MADLSKSEQIALRALPKTGVRGIDEQAALIIACLDRLISENQQRFQRSMKDDKDDDDCAQGGSREDRAGTVVVGQQQVVGVAAAASVAAVQTSKISKPPTHLTLITADPSTQLLNVSHRTQMGADPSLLYPTDNDQRRSVVSSSGTGGGGGNTTIAVNQRRKEDYELTRGDLQVARSSMDHLLLTAAKGLDQFEELKTRNQELELDNARLRWHVQRLEGECSVLGEEAAASRDPIAAYKQYRRVWERSQTAAQLENETSSDQKTAAILHFLEKKRQSRPLFRSVEMQRAEILETMRGATSQNNIRRRSSHVSSSSLLPRTSSSCNSDMLVPSVSSSLGPLNVLFPSSAGLSVPDKLKDMDCSTASVLATSSQLSAFVQDMHIADDLKSSLLSRLRAEEAAEQEAVARAQNLERKGSSVIGQGALPRHDDLSADSATKAQSPEDLLDVVICRRFTVEELSVQPGETKTRSDVQRRITRRSQSTTLLGVLFTAFREAFRANALEFHLCRDQFLGRAMQLTRLAETLHMEPIWEALNLYAYPIVSIETLTPWIRCDARVLEESSPPGTSNDSPHRFQLTRAKGIIGFISERFCRGDNPMKHSVVRVYASSNCTGPSSLSAVLEKAGDLHGPYYMSSAEEGQGQYVEVDFDQFVILPTAYSFASTHPITAGHFPRSWRLEGSLNGKDWVLLRRHILDESLTAFTPMGLWKIEGGVHRVSQVFSSVDPPSLATANKVGEEVHQDHHQAGMFYRRFRVVHEGINACGSHALSVSSFELYGRIMFVASSAMSWTPSFQIKPSAVDVSGFRPFAPLEPPKVEKAGGKKGGKKK